MRALFVVAILIPFIRGEVYSSAADMMEVFKLERDLASIMNGYASKLQKKLEKINAYLQEFDDVMRERQSTNSDADLLEKIATNPIHAYKMMKRFTVDWKVLETELKSLDWDEIDFALKKKKLGSVIPREEDLHGAAQALIRLQDIYELDIRHLSQGDLGIGRDRVMTRAGLNAQDCLFMGKHCFNAGLLARSLEWFEEAWVMAGAEGNRTVKQEQVQQFLDHAAKVHDIKVLNGEKGPDLFPRPVYEESPYDQRERMNIAIRKQFEANMTSPRVQLEDLDLPRFSALCRGEELRPATFVAELKCSLQDKQDPYYKLGPIKEELMHKEPHIWMYHDVVSPFERAEVIKAAGPLMMRSQVQAMSGGGNNSPGSQVSMTRTSKTGWLQDSFSPAIKKMTDRIAHITGLSVNTYYDEAELLQVANYINGGHYSPHHDYVLKEKDPDHLIYKPDGTFVGDRIATWMFYLTQPSSGGRTVFPRIGAGVPATEGAAVFWYNVFPNGAPDKMTLHGACPVMYGTKWVSNKWIREGAQVFNRKCDLVSRTRYDYEF